MHGLCGPRESNRAVAYQERQRQYAKVLEDLEHLEHLENVSLYGFSTTFVHSSSL